jgi:hypothetical protein
MLYKFERVLDGVGRYINNEIYSGMNDLQEVVARVLVGRILGNEESIKNALINNGIVRTFGIIDSDGMIDVESITEDLKSEIERKGKLVVSIPMFGKMSFVPDDVDTLYKYIIGELK